MDTHNYTSFGESMAPVPPPQFGGQPANLPPPQCISASTSTSASTLSSFSLQQFQETHQNPFNSKPCINNPGPPTRASCGSIEPGPLARPNAYPPGPLLPVVPVIVAGPHIQYKNPSVRVVPLNSHQRVVPPLATIPAKRESYVLFLICEFQALIFFYWMFKKRV